MADTRSWLRANWRTLLILLLILGVAAFLRAYFVWGEFYPAGYWSFKGDYSGGSDPFYWERALNYSFQTGKEISWDYAMNYPIGTQDVRPPLFDWFNLLAGYIISPLFGSAWTAAVFMLIVNAALFGVLTIIPTYLLGKEAFGRRVGIIAALLLALSPAALQRSHATIAVHDSWTLFFVVCAFYFYLRALKTLNRKTWVENWFSLPSIRAGLRTFRTENSKSLLYAALAGMSVGVTALSWQGWAYVPVILVLIFGVELLMDRIRNQDTMGVTILFALILGLPLLVSFPWYSVRHLIGTWWDVPFYLFAVALVLGIVFSVTRDYPWTLVIPATVVAGGLGLAIGATVNPSLLLAFYSGAGYFVKTKVYQTIAEAQEPGMSELFLSFGWFTFLVGLAAVGLMIWQFPRRNNPANTMLVFWLFGALFMALAAARFIFNAAPVFAVATGYGIDLVLTRMGLAEMRRTYRSLAEGSRRNAFRKAVKVRHVLTILFVVLLVLTNAWFAVDAGIPYNQKQAYDAQINSALPSFLRAPGFSSTSGSTFYLGAFGYALPKATDYFPAAWSWLNAQDTNLSLEQRPAFLSWWDYGFEAAQRGGHPVVADPFQNGYAIAGQIMLSQNESAAISLMTIRLIEGDYWAHSRSLSPAVVASLNEFGVSPYTVQYVLAHPTQFIPIVLADPQTYGPWDSNMQWQNAQYIYLSHVFLQAVTAGNLPLLYRAITQDTGTSIGYFAVDTRLFPLSARNTGIFYAPAKLTDHRVINLPTGQVMPQDFFQIFADTNRGNHLPVQILGPADTITNETLEYQPMFYNSMFYRAYIGYTPADLGQPSDKGIPGFDQALASYAPNPGYNLTHFRLIYRTAYYNPNKDVSNHTGAWQAIDYADALALQAKISAGKATGVVDLSTQASVSNGIVMLRYYDGAWINGTITVGGRPVPNAWVTVVDELNTPHYLTKTDANGHYSALAPFGNITLYVSDGNLTKPALRGNQALAQVTLTVTMDQALRANQDLNGDGVPDWLITRDIQVPTMSATGHVYFDLNRDGRYGAGDALAPGATVTLTPTGTPMPATVTADALGLYSAAGLPPGVYATTVSWHGHTVAGSPFVLAPGSTSDQNIAVPFGSIVGTVAGGPGGNPDGALVTVTDPVNRSAWQTTVNVTGAFTIAPVFYGTVSLAATLGITSSLAQRVSVGPRPVTANLTLLPSGWVTGTATLDGVPQGYLTLSFQSESDNANVITVITDAQGRFNATLPAGAWDVNGRAYAGGALYAYLGRASVVAGEPAALNPSFAPGARLSGTVTGAGVTANVQSTVAILSPSGDLWVRSGSNGTYVAYLPLGTYAVQAYVGTYSAFAGVTLQWSRTLDLTLSSGATLSGTVYWDLNGNGAVDPGEGVVGARVDLTDNLGFEALAVANVTGGFRLNGFANRTYAGTITAVGFAPVAVGPAALAAIGPDTRFALLPLSVSVTGRVLLNGTALLSRTVTIHAVAESASARSANVTSQTDGSYSLVLTPGSYGLVVDENASATNASRYQNLGTDSLDLFIGEGSLPYDLSIAYRILVAGNLTVGGVPGPGTVSFQGPDARTVTVTGPAYRTYLQVGTYSVSANRTVSGVSYALLTNVTLPVVGNLSLALSRAVYTSGTLTYNGVGVSLTATVSFARNEGGTIQATTTSNGVYQTYLVTGNYTISLSATGTTSLSGVTRYYAYSFHGTLTVPPGSNPISYGLALTRALDNDTVSGSVTLGGNPVDAVLRFIASDPSALNATVAVPTSGAYSVSLAPGAYVVYATRALGGAAFLGTLTVSHAATTAFDVALAAGYVLSGVTTDTAGDRVPANLTFTGTETLHSASDATGAYSVLLPAGTYDVSAVRPGTDRGLTVEFSASSTVVLTADSLANLQLEKDIKRGVTLVWDASQNRTIQPGGTVTYTVVVRNTGNVADAYTLSGLTTGWTFTFSPSSVNLDYGVGGNSTAVNVTIQAPSNALVTHGPVTIEATSVGDPSVAIQLNVIVGIARLRSVSLSVDMTSGTFDGRYLNYTVNVKNAGNDAETVTLSVTNPSDLASGGWIVHLANATGPLGGATLIGLQVPANTTVAVRLAMQEAGGASGVTVVLQVAAQDNAAVSAGTQAVLVLPDLSAPKDIVVSGPGVVQTLPPNYELYAILIGAAVGVALGLWATRRRR